MKPTAAELTTASEYLDREAKRAEALFATAKVLREAGTLQARVEEGEKRLAALQADLEAQSGKLKDARDAVEAETLRAETIASHASAEAQRVRDGAQREAEAVVAKAKEEAGSIKAQAEAEAKRVRDHAAQVKQMADDGHATAKTALESAGKALEDKRAELAEINARIAEAHAAAERIIRKK